MDLLLVLLTFIFVFFAGVFVDGSGSSGQGVSGGLADGEGMDFLGDHGEALLAIQMDLLQHFPWLTGEDFSDKDEYSVAGLGVVPGQVLGVEARGAEAGVFNGSFSGVEVGPQVRGTLRVRVSSLGSGRSVLLSIDSLSTIGEWNTGIGSLEDDVWDDMEIVSGK